MSEAFKPAAAGLRGDDVYRRSIYTNWRRTGPPPAMLAFDALAGRSVLQNVNARHRLYRRLILLNGVQYVEAARVLGETLHRDAAGDLNVLLEQGCLRCLSRPPDPREIEILTLLYREQQEYFRNHTSEADELLKIGQTPRDETLSSADVAAATIDPGGS